MRDWIANVTYTAWQVGAPVAAAAALYWFFGIAGLLHWYLVIASGSSLAFALTAVVTNFDDHPGLISRNYFEFCDTLEQALFSLQFAWMSGPGHVVAPPRRQVIDRVEWFVAQILSYFGPLLVFAWSFIFAPFLYPLYAVLGSPARLAAQSPGVTYRERDGSSGWVFDRDEMPEGAEEINIAHRGVTFTAILTAATLWIVSQIF